MIKIFEIILLSLTVFFEAAGECTESKIAHAWVVKNRVESSLFADTYYDVIFHPKHFSCFNPNELNKHLDRLYSKNSIEVRSYQKCLIIAYRVYNNEIEDNTDGSLWYSLKGIQRKWMRDLTLSKQYGKTNFYRM